MSPPLQTAYLSVSVIALAVGCYQMEGGGEDIDGNDDTSQDTADSAQKEGGPNSRSETPVEDGFDFTDFYEALDGLERTYIGIIEDGYGDLKCRHEGNEFRLELSPAGEMRCFNAADDRLTGCDEANFADTPLKGKLMLESHTDIPVTGYVRHHPPPFPPDLDLQLTYISPFAKEHFGNNLAPGEFQEPIDSDDVYAFEWVGSMNDTEGLSPENEVCFFIVDRIVPGFLPPPDW